MYPGGAKMTLSVKEVSSTERDDRVLRRARDEARKTKDLPGLGQGAFQVTDGSVVVRKDYKVLLIDVTKLPAQFGVPPHPAATSRSTSRRRSWGAGPARSPQRAPTVWAPEIQTAEFLSGRIDNPSIARTNPLQLTRDRRIVR